MKTKTYFAADNFAVRQHVVILFVPLARGAAQ
jgi:hypothetical protein